MKRLIYLSIALFGLFMMSSCNKAIDKAALDPNNPTSVPPGIVLEALLANLPGQLQGDVPWGSVPQYEQYWGWNYPYYGNNEYGFAGASTFSPYTNELEDVVQMDAEAKSNGAPNVNPFEAIGKFINAYYFYNMTFMMGDIPLTNALNGISNATPTYTDQKDVLLYVLNVLDSANSDFASLISSGNNLLTSGDIYYSNNLVKWQKLVNSFKLRVLIELSNKTSDPDLNVAQQFANIFNNPAKYPIFQSTSDDLEFVYISAAFNPYPLNPGEFSDGKDFNMAQTYVQNLTNLNDARVFMTCEPAWAIVDSLNLQAAPTDYRAFVGGNTSGDEGVMRNLATTGYLSFPNRERYYSGYVGEPNIIVGYKEMCFNIAEAINRGWITGNAETWYETGIEASMQFYGLDPAQTSFTAYFLPPNSSEYNYTPYSFNFNFNTYYSQPAVKYAGGSAGLNQILLQKYLAMFQNSGWEAYFNWRRTGVPAFQSGTGTGNNGVIPLRWTYPVGEQTYNKANWQAALKAQGFASDNINGVMWILQ